MARLETKDEAARKVARGRPAGGYPTSATVLSSFRGQLVNRFTAVPRNRPVTQRRAQPRRGVIKRDPVIAGKSRVIT